MWGGATQRHDKILGSKKMYGGNKLIKLKGIFINLINSNVIYINDVIDNKEIRKNYITQFKMLCLKKTYQKSGIIL